MKQFMTFLCFCVAWATYDTASTPKPKSAVKFDSDREIVQQPKDDLFVVQIPDVSDTIAKAVAECQCENCCDCDAKLKDLESRIAALEEKCDKCCQAPQPLQGTYHPAGAKTFTLNGTVYNFKDYVARHTDPRKSIYDIAAGMSLDQHLRDHGASDFGQLTMSEKAQLHTALHHAGVEPEGEFTYTQKSVPRQTVQRSTRTYSSGGCANGQCSQPRARLFGRWR